MSDDEKRGYQTVTSLPSLKRHIAVPPLKMVLVGEPRNSETEAMSGEGAFAQDGSPEAQAAKERVVRRIIAHLKKET